MFEKYKFYYLYVDYKITIMAINKSKLKYNLFFFRLLHVVAKKL